MDRHTREQRRRNMQAIRSRDTSIELTLRKALWARGHRYRKHYELVPGRPDIAFPGRRIAIFCDGDFWHGYKWEERRARIKSNHAYWFGKIERNMQKDAQVGEALRELGWAVLRFWEHEIRSDPEACIARVERLLAEREHLRGRALPEAGGACRRAVS